MKKINNEIRKKKQK